MRIRITFHLPESELTELKVRTKYTNIRRAVADQLDEYFGTLDSAIMDRDSQVETMPYPNEDTRQLELSTIPLPKVRK
jgi:hypothetical protein